MKLSLDVLWHMRGHADLPPAATPARVIARIDGMLERQHKQVEDSGEDFIRFDSPLWRGFFSPNWLAMVIYDRGRFWIDPNGDRLHYELRSLHAFLYCLAAAGVAFLAGYTGDGVSSGLKFGLIGFGWLYGMNILLAYLRVPGLIQRATDGA